MSFELWAGGGAGLLLLAAFAFTLRSLLSSRRDGEHDVSDLSEVRVEKYRPMARLMSAEDIQFLRSQPGYQPSMERRLRAERRGLMRQYLCEMEADFNAIYRAAAHLLMLAPIDQPELSSSLTQQRFMFVRQVMVIRFGLYLDAVGIGTVEVGGLLEAFSNVQRQFSSLSEMTIASSSAAA